MENYFSNEINYTRKELTRLKTTAQKSASNITTTSQSIQVNIPLSLRSTYTAMGEVDYKITTESNALVSFTLDKYYDDITYDLLPIIRPRERLILPLQLDANTMFLNIQARGNGDDVQTLTDGGSVTITNTLTVRSTAPFTIEQA